MHAVSAEFLYYSFYCNFHIGKWKMEGANVVYLELDGIILFFFNLLDFKKGETTEIVEIVRKASPRSSRGAGVTLFLQYIRSKLS